MELALRLELPQSPPRVRMAFARVGRSDQASAPAGGAESRDMKARDWGHQLNHAEAASNEELLGAVSHSGDTAAFSLLFERYAGRVYQTGMNLTRNTQLSRDLVQETMLTVWQKAHLFDLDRGSADNWIFTLTRNRCFDMLRKAKRQPVCVSADDIWPPGEESEVAPARESGAAEQSALFSRIEELLERLPPEQRSVIQQVYVGDYTHEEAAKRLNIPLGTLKSRLRLGLDKLKHLAGVKECSNE